MSESLNGERQVASRRQAAGSCTNLYQVISRRGSWNVLCGSGAATATGKRGANDSQAEAQNAQAADTQKIAEAPPARDPNK